ncbi:Uma2 family endonuclease [Pseudanabaena galeata UHCC 0370]|uniref:Uma2 family endonuclease n=1 Tax=Pseudanabaena galeata UHCC 0370 TaxID=3110310 RepID=A0ABU5TCV6_9CYAN|nr:Uma2 family endonuclease [Pseudanabaena galeata]MEA5476111.1 Uma2 family endonuclease [Pseudanabaena galeata UHCC 0370]
MQITEAPIKATGSPTVPPATLTLPDHKQLPDSDATFVKNFQEHPQSIVLTSSITPILEKLHPDGRYCIGQDSGIYWRLMEPPEKGAEAPDWFYVPNVPPMLDGEYRRSYVLWKEYVAPLIAIEFVSGNGAEERDTTPPSETEKAGKFWVYEQAIRIPFYVIFDGFRDNLEAYQLINGRYAKMQPNQRGHYSILPMGVELGMILENGVSWLRWWDESGNLLLTGDERAIAEKQARLNAEAIADQQKAIAEQATLAQQQAEAIADQERQQKENLANYLRSIGVDPDTLK